MLPLDEGISARAVELLRRHRLSHGLLIPDALMAATALAQENQRDYRVIEALNLLPYPEPFTSA